MGRGKRTLQQTATKAPATPPPFVSTVVQQHWYQVPDVPFAISVIPTPAYMQRDEPYQAMVANVHGHRHGITYGYGTTAQDAVWHAWSLRQACDKVAAPNKWSSSQEVASWLASSQPLAELEPLAPSAMIPAVDDLLTVNMQESIATDQEEDEYNALYGFSDGDGDDYTDDYTDDYSSLDTATDQTHSYHFYGLVTPEAHAANDSWSPSVPVWGHEEGQPLPEKAYTLVRFTDGSDPYTNYIHQGEVVGVHLDKEAAIQLAEDEQAWRRQAGTFLAFEAVSAPGSRRYYPDSTSIIVELPITDDVVLEYSAYSEPALPLEQDGIIWQSGD